MPQGKPRNGEFYNHFKNKLYQVQTIAKHTETGEDLVIYQALYGDYQVYARPLAMFTSEVDREAYPNATQKYRFQLAEPDKAGGFRTVMEEGEADGTGKMTEAVGETVEGVKPKAEKKEITELLMDFYDAETCEEKYEILTAMQKDITDVMIDNMAVVLDVVIPEGDLYQRYDELRTCLKTRQRYEIRRS